ncbi:hypothetical protein BKG93_04030 [Rodentibacter ratti]|uniref:Bacteriophage CI repressor N-terminal domain-containing protein n=1 Tax=Rodentibacter ratti TaxID=1906745 RepID=A0A1V3L7N6_9PAST|nr:helix-turn-helix domain-containing protein [Rodentibacter ratti]OOF85855.1 hypothetical protein BKG93_04030 [Rodentibacter ratti]
MENFTNILNRLKTVLSVSMDKEVAEFLGLTKSAFAERKRRGVFPENALRLAELNHPELRLDIDYILTGESGNPSYDELDVISSLKNTDMSNKETFKTEIPSTPVDADTSVLLNFDEMRLLSYFRKSDMKGKQLLLDTGKMCQEYSLTMLKWTEYTEKDKLNYTK